MEMGMITRDGNGDDIEGWERVCLDVAAIHVVIIVPCCCVVLVTGNSRLSEKVTQRVSQRNCVQPSTVLRAR